VIARSIQGARRYRHIQRQFPASRLADAVSKIRLGSLRYVRQLQVDGAPYGRHRYSRGEGPPLLYASVFAALLRHLLGDLDAVPAGEREEWAAYINEHQGKDGLFRGPLVANEIAETEDWWGWWHLMPCGRTVLCAARCGRELF